MLTFNEALLINKPFQYIETSHVSDSLFLHHDSDVGDTAIHCRYTSITTQVTVDTNKYMLLVQYVATCNRSSSG